MSRRCVINPETNYPVLEKNASKYGVPPGSPTVPCNYHKYAGERRRRSPVRRSPRRAEAGSDMCVRSPVSGYPIKVGGPTFLKLGLSQATAGETFPCGYHRYRH